MYWKYPNVYVLLKKQTCDIMSYYGVYRKNLVLSAEIYP
jgi:hypothetical protein